MNCVPFFYFLFLLSYLGHWTLRLLADQMVELEIVESISPETVRQTLKKWHDQAEI